MAYSTMTKYDSTAMLRCCLDRHCRGAPLASPTPSCSIISKLVFKMADNGADPFAAMMAAPTQTYEAFRASFTHIRTLQSALSEPGAPRARNSTGTSTGALELHAKTATAHVGSADAARSALQRLQSQQTSTRIVLDEDGLEIEELAFEEAVVSTAGPRSGSSVWLNDTATAATAEQTALVDAFLAELAADELGAHRGASHGESRHATGAGAADDLIIPFARPPPAEESADESDDADPHASIDALLPGTSPLALGAIPPAHAHVLGAPIVSTIAPASTAEPPVEPIEHRADLEHTLGEDDPDSDSEIVVTVTRGIRRPAPEDGTVALPGEAADVYVEADQAPVLPRPRRTDTVHVRAFQDPAAEPCEPFSVDSEEETDRPASSRLDNAMLELLRKQNIVL
eukprot:m.78724 g.78724  ORF g.78724 m.78724 type:complete len:400 (+) comp7978_c0_seq2:23-1222(+)